MKGELWLSEAVDIKDLRAGQLNLIDAKPGAGKTYWAMHDLKDYSMEKYDCEALYLIDTVNGKEQLLSNGRLEENDITGDEYWVIDGLYVMTYAGFATLVRYNPDAWDNHRLVICDELHNCVRYSKWSKEENIHSFAIHYIKELIKKGRSIVVAITATPNRVMKEFGRLVYNVPKKGETRSYEPRTTIKYANLSTVLRIIKPGMKGIIYVPHIRMIKKLIKDLQDKGIKANGFWSIKSNVEMTKEQRRLRLDIINDKVIPPNIDVLIINASAETSMTIGGDIKFMIVHSTDEEVIEQVTGRYRGDFDTLYIHDDTIEDKIILDDKWLNKPLTKADKDILCKELNIPNENRQLTKWVGVKKILLKNDYIITEKKSGSKRYSIISKNDNFI